MNGQELPPDFPSAVARVAGGSYQTVQIGKLHFQGHEDMDLDRLDERGRQGGVERAGLLAHALGE